MGIEPLLLVVILVAMFFVQAGRALVERLQDRLEFSEATRLGVQALTARHQMLPDRDHGGWLAGRDGLSVQVWFDAYPALQVRRVLSLHTGVLQRSQWSHLAWLAPSVLVVVKLNRPLPGTLRICRRQSARPTGIDLRDPVLAQLLRVHSDDSVKTRAQLARRDLREPLLELLGAHPLSVVTHDTVALWCTRAVDDPEPLVELAVEVAAALQATEDRCAIGLA